MDKFNVIKTKTKTISVVLNSGYDESWDDVVGEYTTLEDQISFCTLGGKMITISCTQIAIFEVHENQEDNQKWIRENS